MLLLEGKGIKQSYAERLVLDLPSFKLYAGDRIGVVGANGAGKTTLLRILAGEVEPDEGSVKRFVKHSCIRQIEDTSGSGASEERTADTLSGGEITQAKIDRALQAGGEILFADEPTAHLDLQRIRELEEQLLAFTGALLLVSHDRALLDRICTKILEIESGHVTEYIGNYTSYRQQKDALVARQGLEYDLYQREQKRLLAAMREKEERVQSMRETPTRMGNSEARLHRRGAGHAKKKLANAAKSIATRIEKLERKEKPREKPAIHFDIKEGDRLESRVAIRATGLNRSFGKKTIFRNARFTLFSGTKAALLGNNGSGKTTLLRMILAKEPGIELARAAKIGYLSQGLEELCPEQTVLENVMANGALSMPDVRNLLGRLLFRGDEANKPVGVLSGGERVKATFACMLAWDFNLLVLDEPTNFLDVESLEALEDILVEYPGTVLFVSHDRRFVERIADCILLIEDHTIVQFDGTYTEFVRHRQDLAGDAERRERRQLLEHRLSQVLGKLSLAPKGPEYEALDAEYNLIQSELREPKAAAR